MNVNKLSTDEIRDLFEIAFADKVGDLYDISAFDIECERANETIIVYVKIAGHADTPTMDDFRQGEVKEAQIIELSRDDVGDALFMLDQEDTLYLSGNDYQLTYRMED